MKLTFLMCFSLGVFLGWFITKWNALAEAKRRCTNCVWTKQAIDSSRKNSPASKQGIARVSEVVFQELENLHRRYEAKRKCEVNHIDIDGLIHTESGGNPEAQADPVYDNGGKVAGYRSKGICQMGKGAWEDALAYLDIKEKVSYSDTWNIPVINRIMADIYVNEVLPKKYFAKWGIPDNIQSRLAAYKCGPGRLHQLYKEKGEDWMQFLPETVKRDIVKYNLYIGALSLRSLSHS